MKLINKGIHHITAIAGDPQENADFYTGVLGLRMVKKTVNFDDPETYHLYFGDYQGTPGTVITFFPRPNGEKGVLGGGQVGVSTYAVPKGALLFWEERLAKFHINFTLETRFEEKYISFQDPHGLQIEITERAAGAPSRHSIGTLTEKTAIKGFQGATLYSTAPDKTGDLLENLFGFEKIGEDRGLIRYKSPQDLGDVLDLKKTAPAPGTTGVGTVHHIAFRASNDQEQLAWKKLLEDQGYRVTEVRDRNYFKSIYFNEEGGILFEIATEGPGFDVDEPLEKLGERFMLPEEYQPVREKLEKKLPKIVVRELEK
ncbi:ring-cleaving dioxygenase [Isachenkonia alkalipeptolytica]|uniref:Ring-cleaving dioxygenase n=1 Tax=Isachenkonia alkalipeptolytica TaxID=2565777 RepID=A0AA44BEW9_9CLOT|nr:ring-cleaving dioxygenase [Isachenkonia alkalipeptolytica]NBG88590.1 ring-cleaving dioxygenase [Isachenkonia alkalipeptolytica]